MLDKLDRILELVQDVNFTLKRTESQDESRHMNSIPSDDIRDSRVIRDVHVSSKTTSIIEDIWVDSDINSWEGHASYEGTSEIADVIVESSTSLTDVHDIRDYAPELIEFDISS